jgi:transcription initiation factor TFIIB
MDSFFTSLDEFTESTIEKKEACCDIIKNHVLHNGLLTCSQCNNTISNIIDGPEWRFYGASDTKSSDPTRCGMPLNQLLPESSVGTSISYRGNSYTMNKMRRYQQWNGMPYKERSLLKVFEDISRLCKENDISGIIINEAHSLYKIVSSTKISRGSNRSGIIAACVYFSCKINKVPRSTNEIADIFNIKIPVMTKGCKKFQEIMQMNKLDINRINNTTTISMDDFIDRFCSKLKLLETDIEQIKEISYLSQLYNLVNENTPPSMAAGCIYLHIKSNDIDIHKKQISDICKISEVTINKCYKKLESHVNKLIKQV